MASTRKKKNKWIWFLAGGVVLIIIIAVAVGNRKKTGVTVETALVKKAEIVEKVNATGKIQPETEVKLSPEISGEITELYVKEGDSVVKGQLLVRIRPDNFQTAVQRAESSLNTARANISQAQARVLQAEAQLTRSKVNYDRQKQLYDQKVISQAEFEQSTAEYRVAQQELQAAKQSVTAAHYTAESAKYTVNETVLNLERTSIFAPVSGIVSKLAVEQGERVVGTAQMAGTELLRIANLNDMEVRVDVNENDIVRVNLGDTAIVEVDAYNDRKFTGVVTAIANTANQTVSAESVTEFEVKIRVLAESYKDLKAKTGKLSPFRPGTTAGVEIITERRKGVLSVPIAAVTAKTREEVEKLKAPPTKKPGQTPVKTTSTGASQKKGEKNEDDQKEYVFVIKEGRAYLREVTTGISDFDNIEILSGLSEGEQIVAGPFDAIQKKLKDGDEVNLPDNAAKAKKN